MRNSILFLALAAATFAFGCSGSLANNSDQATSPVAEPTPVATATPAGVSENECKICSFEFAAYKGDLKNEEVNGLLLALNDEYLAIATYEQVNKDHSSPRPFVNIVEAEKRHAEQLKQLFVKYGVTIPENPWTGNAPKFANISEACKAGVAGEIRNRDLYTKLFRSTERKDIIDVYKYLQRASEENHMPAFERCGGGGGRGPGGRGPGRGPRG